MTGNHPYRKQAQAVNIPDHLLPQIFMDQRSQGQNQLPTVPGSEPVQAAVPPTPNHFPTGSRPPEHQSMYSKGAPGQPHPVQTQQVHQHPHINGRSLAPTTPTNSQFGQYQSPPYPIQQQQPYQHQQQQPLHQVHLPVEPLDQSTIPGQQQMHQQRVYNNSRNASASSLTYSRNNASQDSFKYSRQPSNGHLGHHPHHQSHPQGQQQPSQAPYPTINSPMHSSAQFSPQQFPAQQFPAQQLPGQQAPPQKEQQYPQLNHKPVRKAPNGHSPLNTDRRIVSSPNVLNDVGAAKPESRTKSLSSASTKYQQQYQQHMQPIQQGQALGHKPSLSSNASSNSSNTISHSFSLSSKSRSFTSLSKLSSFSTKKFNSSTSLQAKTDRNVSSGTLASQRTILQISKKPQVYPAMLSRVSRVFRESIYLTINTKDGLEYHDTFTGKMAVDIICKIIRTNDRNLALLLGRSLDSQKLFHDVTYNHRLRDSVHEVYAFNHIYTEVELYDENGHTQTPPTPVGMPSSTSLATTQSNGEITPPPTNDGVNGVFTILTDCYSPTCSRNRLCYSIACPRRLEQQARLNLKPQGGLQRAVSRLSLHDQDENKSLWHETVPKAVLDKLDKHEKVRQELIYEFIYTERDYVKDLEFMADFYIVPLRNPSNNIIPEREREAFIRTVFGGVNELLRLAKSMSEALTRRQQQQKPVVGIFGDILLQFVDKFEPFIKYSGNKVFASFENERQQQVNMRYASFLDAIEKRPESRKQDLSSFLMKGIQRPARYQLLLGGILKNTNPESPDYKYLLKAKEEVEKVLGKMNVQTGLSTDRHKIMVLHRLLGKQTLDEKYHFKLSYTNRIVYQATLNRKRDNEKIDVYLFEHALLFVKHKIQNKREHYKVFEKPIYLPLLYVNSGFEIPTFRTVINSRYNGSVISDSKPRIDSTLNTNKLPINFLGLGSQVHTTLNADDIANQNQLLSQISSQQKQLIEKHDIFSLSKYETRRFTGNNKINCAVPGYGGKKLLYGTDSGVWVSTVRTISMTNNEKICSDPTMVISKLYVTQIEVLVEYSKLLILSDKTLYEFDLSCTDSLDHVKNTRSGRLILSHVTSFKTGICDGKLLVCAIKSGSTHAINIFEPANPFDKNRNKNKKYDIREITFSSDPTSISFLRTRLCIGCTKGFEILSLEDGKNEPILDEADPSLDFATQKEIVNPLAIHRLGKDFLLSYAEFSFLINRNGWRTKHDWGIFWEGNPTNIALFYPYLLSFESNFIEIRDLETTTLIRALIGENIRFLHSNEHEAMYACEENGYDVIVSIDFLNLKPKTEPF